MKSGVRGYFALFKQAATDWVDDHAPRLGAALAFYTIFSLAPLLTIVVTIASLWFTENADQQVYSQMGSVIGVENADNLKGMMSQQGEQKSGVFTAIAAGVMLVFGATGVFVQLQDALNEIWEVEQKPGQGIMGFIRHRLLSFAMILGIGFLLLTSLLLSTAISAVGKYFSGWFGDMTVLWHAINMVVSFGLITLLFALMFKYVPDAKISWRDVWFGAIVTSILFTAGKFGLSLYLGKSSVVSTYSAAGGLLIVLLWVYYTSQIVFYGAELTQAYAYAAGRNVEPSAHAQWDAEKLCAADAREKKKKEKRENAGTASPILQPAYGVAAVGAAPGAVSGRGRASRLGKMLLLLVALIPLERKLRSPRH